MQKLFVPILLVLFASLKSFSQQKSFDQPIQLKSCNISIDSNPFIATTVMELEFYNPQDKEVEGYQQIQLGKGQVITGFQLDLNGKYREGSIEERWKANNAYNSIVGKRIDPAILQMEYADHYSLRIYPIAARSSRKVKITVTQLMQADSAKLTYNLPLSFSMPTESFKLKIKINNTDEQPICNKGVLENWFFYLSNNNASFDLESKNVLLNKPVSFSVIIPANKPLLCISSEGNEKTFLLRYSPQLARYYDSRPRSVSVFWDASLSSSSRNIMKELDFLEKFVDINGISSLSVILFNQKILDTLYFSSWKNKFSEIKKKLANYNYNGATTLGNLDFKNANADAVLLFSDGINTLDQALPKPGAVQVSCIVSSKEFNQATLEKITGTTGGMVINLNSLSVDQAVKRIEKAENFLFKINSTSGIELNETLPLRLQNNFLLTGKVHHADNLELLFGNNMLINKTAVVNIDLNNNCVPGLYKKIQMLKRYETMINRGYWEDAVVFGLEERVVTAQTSFLVLERIEDYINYKIAPPKELEDECAARNYVYNSNYKVRQLNNYSEQQALQSTVSLYNQRINWWSKVATPIDLSKAVIPENAGNADEAKKRDVTSSSGRIVSAEMLQLSALSEVVVTSAYQVRRSDKSLAYSVQHISNDQLSGVFQTNFNQALAGKVAGIEVRQNYDGGMPQTSLRLRGATSMYANSAPLYVMDGMILPDINMINVNDISDVTILRGPQASVLYGSEGSNGVIVINSKKPGYRSAYQWSEYKYKSLEDVDYIEDIKGEAADQRWTAYKRLETEHGNSPAFYFDMADFFFSVGSNKLAGEVLFNGIELCKGNVAGLRAAAFLLESRKQFDEAITIYKQAAAANSKDLALLRDLALAYFQNGNYQAAVDTYYSIIVGKDESYAYYSLKESALNEMNAVIAMHKNKIHIAYINQNLIKPLPVDLRIVCESNYNNAGYYFQVREPGGEICSYQKPFTIAGGRFGGGYYYTSENGEYSIKKASTGNYKLKVHAYNYNSGQPGAIPNYARVIIFKNFQSENQTMQIKNIEMDNQYGLMELDPVKW